MRNPKGWSWIVRQKQQKEVGRLEPINRSKDLEIEQVKTQIKELKEDNGKQIAETERWKQKASTLGIQLR